MSIIATAAFRARTRLPPRRQAAARFAGLVGAVGIVVSASRAGGAVAGGAQPSLTTASRVFSKVQSARGEQAYRTACGYCHKDDLSGGFMDDGVGRAPALAGPRAFGSSFAERWRDQTLGDMVYVIASTMPKQAPTSLTLDSYVDIVAYLLDKNGAPAGSDDLPADIPTLRDVLITPPK